MPISAKEVDHPPYLRLLILGGAKSGKTTTVLRTCPKPAYVINSDDKFSLNPAKRYTTDFVWDLVLGDSVAALQKTENAISEARKGVKEGRYKTVVWDTITKYSRRVCDVFAEQTFNAKGEPDGRRYWPMYHKHLDNIMGRLFALDAHVIVNAHYLDVSSPLIEGQQEKTGEGIVPLLYGQSRATIPADFQDVVFLEKKGENRIFTCSATGVWGPGARSLPGVTALPADVEELWKTIQELNSPKTSKGEVVSKTKKETAK